MMRKSEMQDTLETNLIEDYRIIKTYTQTDNLIEYILIKESKKEPCKEELQEIKRRLKESDMFKEYIISVGKIGDEIIIQINKKGKVKK